MSYPNVERFAFDRIFVTPSSGSEKGASTADVSLEVVALRAEIALLKSEHEAKLALARAEGFEAGLQQARSERDVALLSAVDALHAGIESLDERFAEVSERVTGDAAEIAVVAADMMAGRALETFPADTIDEAISRALGQVARGTEIEIRVHPDLIEAIETKIAARQSADRRKLNLFVIGDVTLKPGDARIGWDQGGLALDAQARREAILAELESLMPHMKLAA